MTLFCQNENRVTALPIFAFVIYFFAMESIVLSKIFEGAMLVCFGTAWPLSIAKLLRVKDSSGKSFFFLYVILCGYLFGIAFKFFKGVDVILYFYIFNILMVMIDITLSHKYKKRIVALKSAK